MSPIPPVPFNPREVPKVPQVRNPDAEPVRSVDSIGFIHLISPPETFDGESKEAPFFRVWVREGSRDGKAKLFWEGETHEVRTETHLLEGEELKLERFLTSQGTKWRIQERRLTEKPESNEILSPSKTGLLGTLEKLLKHEDGPQSQEGILSFLKTYFPFLNWKPDTLVFSWELPKDGHAEGYLGEDVQGKVFILRIENKTGDPSLYRLQWKKKDASDLILGATYSSFKMYLHMGENRKKFMQFLEEYGVRFQEVRISYKPSYQRREWNA
ncbi:hypothetical protein LEP1GSC050_1260 [Leptospira broomii serovar Hurstbridge str. 5399]|uniref:Uncharacterized protein n=1 Tax=Leptospira broomii serovar Hurstbridge str. 5399 TaxID=1049789 RepID=T0GDM6_9LEPT|nr:hypothetical protein [Leptospira broomii]EQA43513.1 hypothetical protein LEP1GSC050_1260 [Leptospira broomii serovar Hurstbridge str. 5399]